MGDAECERLRTQLLRLESEHARTKALLKARGHTIERLRQMGDGAADGVLLHDGDGRILESNRQAARSLGYRDGELNGRHLADIDATFARAKRRRATPTARSDRARLSDHVS